MLSGRVRLENTQIPLHIQIRDYLLMRLENGGLRGDAKLPSEDDLKDTFGVSRLTIRRALDNLRAKGLVRKEQGRGTFWTESAFRLRREKFSVSNRFVTDIAGESELKVLSKTPERASAWVARALRVPLQAPVTAFRRVRLFDGEHVAFATSYLRGEHGRKVSARHLNAMTMLATLEKVLGLDLYSIDYEAEVCRADRDIAQNLGVSILDPILMISSRIVDCHGVPVEASQVCALENRQKFSVSVDIRNRMVR